MAQNSERLLCGHSELAVALEKALGIQSGMVKGFELRVSAGEAATLKVTHYVRESQASALIETLSKFRLDLKLTDEQVIP